ncbi:type II toxin-antitoxin system RelE/ParE family toxin [Asticcacaulis aquaticus]|uniref:type II toxin-antitoxin system RelE/ParE family toxin n=1 Tax=Asticcacaulis aquaticus TaxID=2984212 RepID=UPI0034A1B490
MRVRFTRSARQDMMAIGRYIAFDDPGRSQSFVEELRDKCRSLKDLPLRGANRSALIAGVKLLPHKNYNIYYGVTDETVTIFRVLHSTRHVDEGDL